MTRKKAFALAAIVLLIPLLATAAPAALRKHVVGHHASTSRTKSHAGAEKKRPGHKISGARKKKGKTTSAYFPKAKSEPMQQVYQQAYTAFQNGDGAHLADAVQALRGDLLEPWGLYWQLALALQKDDNDQGVAQYLKVYADSYAANRLRNDWVIWLGARRRWEDVLAAYESLLQPDAKARCAGLYARWAIRKDRAALDEGMTLWATYLDNGEACTPLFDALDKENRLDAETVWVRVHRAAEQRRNTALRDALRYLPAAQMPPPALLTAALTRPGSMRTIAAETLNSRGSRESFVLALLDWARDDPDAAAAKLKSVAGTWPAHERAYAWQLVAWQAAQQLHPQALAWYQQGNEANPSPSYSEAQMSWRVRAALRAGDWAAVRDAVLAMPPALQADPAWTYWLGRALDALGAAPQAQEQYRKIANQHHFYGNLAAEALGQSVRVPERATPPSREEMDSIRAKKTLQRALALLAAGVRTPGVGEWNWAVQRLDDRQLLAAAAYARDEDALDRAIYAALRTVSQHDFSLRYPAPHRTLIEAESARHGVDPAWVYGLIRQESRFVPQARSQVGASGLMQVMPATAAHVAKRMGIAYNSANRWQPETNIALGTAYLRMVLDTFAAQPAMATAAYNAGPGRIRRWCGDQPMEGAVFAETIPFSETRDYVKQVLSGATYYAALLGSNGMSLKSRLGTVPRCGG